MLDVAHVRAQIAQYSPADQAGVQATLRAIVRATPADPQAWLYLSACVASLPQRRDCLEQAQYIDPHNPAVYTELRALRDQELYAMQRRLSDCRSIVPAPSSGPILRLGEYFQAQGIATDRIQRALEIQRTAPLSSRRPLLGEILVAQGWSTPEHVADLLMRQTYVRITEQGLGRPDILGEQLLAQGHISIRQLHSAVICQLHAIQTGTHIRLGQVLISQNAISATQLAAVLHDQEIMYQQRYY